MPFSTLDGNAFPVPVLAQVEPEVFEICVPFRYRRRTQDDWITVPKSEEHRRTDLASVPRFMLWLVPRYGVHTLAALVHDQLVDDPPPGGRVEADTIFRDALGELKVPLIRRWMMWAAVSVGATAESFAGKIRVAVWAFFLLVASATFWQHVVASFTDLSPWQSWLVFGHGLLQDLLVVALASVLFVPRIGLGLLAGGSVLTFFVPTVAVLAWIGLYVVLDVIARGGVWLYNEVVVRLANVQPLENVPVIMSRSDDLPVAPSGCPELR